MALVLDKKRATNKTRRFLTLSRQHQVLCWDPTFFIICAYALRAGGILWGL